jgi:pyridoxal phosphate enzyme (YggS family)
LLLVTCYPLPLEVAAAGIEKRLAAIRERISRACERAGSDPARITLVGAAKTMPVSTVAEALKAGLRDVGENTVQEAHARKDALGAATLTATWHLIGHLQTNKVRDALAIFDVIHSVDSLRLARHISDRATATIQVLLEVNVGAEASKFGFSPAGVAAAAAAIGSLPHLELSGLMTVAPATADPENVRPIFRTLRELAIANGLDDLSMGMTDDFEIAIEEGATLVRVGRALFGERMAMR